MSLKEAHLLLHPQCKVPQVKGVRGTAANAARRNAKEREEGIFARIHVRIAENWSAKVGIVDDRTRIVQRDGSSLFLDSNRFLAFLDSVILL